MNGTLCKACLVSGKKKNMRRMHPNNRHRDAKLGKPRWYRCKSCGWRMMIH